MEDPQKQQEIKVETVENNEQVQDENGNENQAQTQNNDEQSEENTEKRNKYEEEQIARINLIFANPTNFQELYDKYAKEFQAIAQKRAKVKSLKEKTNEENKDDKTDNNENEQQESETKTTEKELEAAEKELKDAEKKFAGRWGLNHKKLPNKIEVLQVKCVATVVSQELPFDEKKKRYDVLEKVIAINLYKKLQEFTEFLQVIGVEAELEQFGNGMAKFDPGCDAYALSYFLDEFCELEKQKEEKEKEENEKKSIKDKAKEAKEKADQQNKNNENNENNEQKNEEHNNNEQNK